MKRVVLFIEFWTTLFIPEIPNSDLRAETDVPKVYPTFRTQWNRFWKLIRTSVRVMAINVQFKLNRFKRFSRRFNLYRTNGKSNRLEIWNLTIISHYGSDETGFVEIRDFLKNGYFNSPSLNKKNKSMRFELLRSNDNSDWHENWNPVITNYYGSNETSFVQFWDCSKIG